MTVKIMTLPIK